jgi:hypothetical protein
MFYLSIKLFNDYVSSAELYSVDGMGRLLLILNKEGFGCAVVVVLVVGL